MTKDEAIRILPDMKGAGSEWDMAIDMAIEALNQFAGVDKKVSAERQEGDLITSAQPDVPDTNVGDMIYRQAAVDAISTWDKFGVDERGRLVRWHEGLELYVHLRDVLTAIVNLPSAQPELIEKTAYIRGFEQGRTQGMIDAQGGKK